MLLLEVKLNMKNKIANHIAMEPFALFQNQETPYVGSILRHQRCAPDANQ